MATLTIPTIFLVLMESEGEKIVFKYKGYTVRHWTPSDRESVSNVIKGCLESYGLQFEPSRADRDAVEVDDFYYKNNKGEFWTVIEDSTGKLVGTGGYYQLEEKNEDRSNHAQVEIRKMYLTPSARGKQLGRTLLQVCH